MVGQCISSAILSQWSTAFSFQYVISLNLCWSVQYAERKVYIPFINLIDIYMSRTCDV